MTTTEAKDHVLSLRREWLEPGFMPSTLVEAPFVQMRAQPPFPEILTLHEREPTEASIEVLADHLLAVVRGQLEAVEGEIHLLLSGGYDSRILAYLLVELGKEFIAVTDGMEDPACESTMQYLGIPPSHRYVHDMNRPDPYGIVGKTVEGWAPLWSQVRFLPDADRTGEATLITGLGGGEWFSYPASGWHRGKVHRLPHTDVVNMWLDCWPQYTLIHRVWERGYRAALHPYTTLDYARVASCCPLYWLVEIDPARELDAVRQAMMAKLDDRLEWLGYSHHRYDWNLDHTSRGMIDGRYQTSKLWQYHKAEWGMPSMMDQAPHACLMAGFATWIEHLESQGYQVELPEPRSKPRWQDVPGIR